MSADRARSGVRLLALGLAIEWLFGAAAQALSIWAVSRLRSGADFSEVDGLFAMSGWAGLAGFFLGAILVLVALQRLLAAGLAGTRAVLTAALAIFGVAIGVEAFIEIYHRFLMDSPPGAWMQRIYDLAGVLTVGGLTVLLVALVRVARTLGVQVPPAVVALGAVYICWVASMWVLPHIPDGSKLLRDPDWRWARLFIALGLRLPILWLLWRLGSGRGGPGLPEATAHLPDGLAAPHLDERRWEAPLAGLTSYRGALVAKIVVVVASAVLLFMAVSARSIGLAKGVMVLAPLVDIIISFVLIGALWTYAKVPVETEARETAVIGAVLAVVQLLLQLYVMWLVFSLVSPGQNVDYDKLRDAQERLPWLELFGQLNGLALLLLLLASFHSLARYLADTALAARVTGVVVAVLVTMVAAGGLRWALAGGKIKSSGSMVMIGLLTLVVAIVMISLYLGLLRDLIERIKSRLRAENAF